MAGEKTFEELVALAVKALESGRPQKAVRNLVDDAARLSDEAVSAGASTVSSAASAVKKALKKLKGEAKPPRVVAPKVAEVVKTAKTTVAAPKVLTKAERRLQNQVADAEKRAVQGGTPAERAAAKAERKAKNRAAYKDKEKQIIDERYSPKTQRESGTPILVKKTEKSLNAIEQKERLMSNQGGSFDARVEKLFESRLKSLTDDGYKLDKSEMKSMYASIKAEVKEQAERNLPVMKENLADRMKNLGKLTPQEMDTEAGRLFFRNTARETKLGNRPPVKQGVQKQTDRQFSDAAESAAAAKAHKARMAESGTGAERGPRQYKPFKESESGLRLQKAQRENAAKAARQSRKDVELHSSKKPYTEEELKSVRIVEKSRFADDTAKSQKKTYEGMGDIKGEPVRSGMRGETTEQLNARIAAQQAKVAKELKAKKAKPAPKKR